MRSVTGAVSFSNRVTLRALEALRGTGGTGKETGRRCEEGWSRLSTPSFPFQPCPIFIDTDTVTTYRVTSLISNSGHLGPYGTTMPGTLQYDYA